MLSNTEGGVRWNPEKQEYEMGGGYYDEDRTVIRDCYLVKMRRKKIF
jgi:hypothetical protein